jgi:SET domain-containing protein
LNFELENQIFWLKMETLCNKGENFQKKKNGSCSSTGSCSSDLTEQEKRVKGCSSSLPIRKTIVSKCSKSDEKENEHVSQVEHKKVLTSISSKISGKFFNFFIMVCYSFGNNFRIFYAFIL